MKRISVYVEDHLEERVLGVIRTALSDNGVPSYDLTSEPAKEKVDGPAFDMAPI